MYVVSAIPVTQQRINYIFKLLESQKRFYSQQELM